MSLALASISVMRFWCNFLSLEIKLKSSAKGVVMILVASGLSLVSVVLAYPWDSLYFLMCSIRGLKAMRKIIPE